MAPLITEVYKLHEVGEGNPEHPLVFRSPGGALRALLEHIENDKVVPMATWWAMCEDIEAGSFNGEDYATDYPNLTGFIVDRLTVA